MANHGRVTHAGADNSTPRQRVASVGVNATSVSEIIYLHRGGLEEEAFTWWLQSSTHCNALTDAKYVNVGASVTRGPFGTAYVVVFTGP